MTTRVTLISPARSESSEEFAFDDGRRGLSPAGEREVRRAREAGVVPEGPALVVVSPSVRCVRTAEGLGIEDAAEHADERLAGCAMGRWRGRTLEEVGADEPEAVAQWLADPEAAPHGGESVARLCARTGEWLDGLAQVRAVRQGKTGRHEQADRQEQAAQTSRRVVVVAEPDVVRAAVLCALGAPAAGLWRVDVAPLTATELTGRAGRWNLRAGVPLVK
jgi:broad specificity phosphatase PhoE